MAAVRRTFCALLALRSTCDPGYSDGADKLRVGLLPFSEALGAVIADKEGYFKAEGIEIEVTKFQGGAAAVPVLQSGRIDIAFSNTVSTLQAIEAGLDAVVLAPAAVVRSAPPDTTTALMVRKDSLKSIKELEGKRVAVNVINSTAWLHAVADLALHGVDYTKVRFTEVPFPQMNDPLVNSQVDAIAQVDPFRSALMATGKAEIVSWPYIESAPGTDITQYLALTSWVEKNHDIAVKFARAVIKGAQFAEIQRRRDARHQYRLCRSQSGAQEQGAAAGVRNGRECRRYDAHHGADAEVRHAQEADRHFESRAEAALSRRR